MKYKHVNDNIKLKVFKHVNDIKFNLISPKNPPQTDDVTQTAGNSNGVGSKGGNSAYIPVNGG